MRSPREEGITGARVIAKSPGRRSQSEKTCSQKRIVSGRGTCPLRSVCFLMPAGTLRSGAACSVLKDKGGDRYPTNGYFEKKAGRESPVWQRCSGARQNDSDRENITNLSNAFRYFKILNKLKSLKSILSNAAPKRGAGLIFTTWGFHPASRRTKAEKVDPGIRFQNRKSDRDVFGKVSEAPHALEGSRCTSI